jgi:hypothetical protein
MRAMPVKSKPCSDEVMVIVSFSPNITTPDLIRELRAASKQISNIADRKVYKIYDFTGVTFPQEHMVMLLIEESRRRTLSQTGLEPSFFLVIDNEQSREEIKTLLQIYYQRSPELFKTIDEATTYIQTVRN